MAVSCTICKNSRKDEFSKLKFKHYSHDKNIHFIYLNLHLYVTKQIACHHLIDYSVAKPLWNSSSGNDSDVLD